MPLMGHERRNAILQSLRGAERPVSGTALADAAGVSRQVIVQDIALLRADGHDIVATNRGYVLREGSSDADIPTRLVKVRHTVEQLEDELNTIVDLGGTVQSVMVNHRAYGKITADLDIRSRSGTARYRRYPHGQVHAAHDRDKRVSLSSHRGRERGGTRPHRSRPCRARLPRRAHAL